MLCDCAFQDIFTFIFRVLQAGRGPAWIIGQGQYSVGKSNTVQPHHSTIATYLGSHKSDHCKEVAFEERLNI